jgi:hypothetical protein
MTVDSCMWKEGDTQTLQLLVVVFVEFNALQKPDMQLQDRAYAY